MRSEEGIAKVSVSIFKCHLKNLFHFQFPFGIIVMGRVCNFNFKFVLANTGG